VSRNPDALPDGEHRTLRHRFDPRRAARDLGLFACCIGALIVMLFTLFYGYYVIDKGQGPTESIGSSFALVKDNAGAVTASPSSSWC